MLKLAFPLAGIIFLLAVYDNGYYAVGVLFLRRFAPMRTVVISTDSVRLSFRMRRAFRWSYVRRCGWCTCMITFFFCSLLCFAPYIKRYWWAFPPAICVNACGGSFHRKCAIVIPGPYAACVSVGRTCVLRRRRPCTCMSTFFFCLFLCSAP